jgi:membrane glycosyltransferase
MTPERLRRVARRRRALFFGLTFLTSTFLTGLMWDILRANGFTALEKAGLALFFILITWITGAFWTAAIGFVVLLRGRDKEVIHSDEVKDHKLVARTAVCMPIYNEDTQRVFAGLDTIWSSIKAEDQQGMFDMFILSDTRKPEVAAAEEIAWRAFVERQGAKGRIFYRRREQNVGRKAGNVADFVRSWGGAYEYAVVLDADSIMTGKSLVTLAGLMDKHPEAGIIQALPMPAGRETLFARLIQFAARLNSSMLANGLVYWQLSEGNYWGHNAILRLRQFAEFCDLPKLPGKPPFGGDILSHDFVEAAFMRRAGYQVWLAADVTGSWEEVPSNTIDYAGRDRRWAQGNLQHLGLLPMRGLHWLSRIHLITGVLSYASSPIWLVVLMLSSVIACIEALQGYQYFEPGTYSLFPSWPESRATEIVALLSITLTILLMPKVFGMTLALVNSKLRRAYGGGFRLFMSVLVEQVFSTLLAPSMMLFHTSFVLTTILGKTVTWDAQERGDRGITFLDALNRHKWHVLFGLIWGAAILSMAPRYIWWLMPILSGLILSVPLTMLTSRASVGKAMRRWGVLLTPEETNTPEEWVALEERMAGGVTAVDGPYHSPKTKIPAPPMAAPTPAATFAPVTVSSVAATALVTAKPGEAANDTFSAPHDEDIVGILSVSNLPARVPLQMEAAAPQYLRPRDALTGLHRLLSAAWT